MKGIILAGGTGSRLYPLTLATSKQLLPVYDKPMIYYPLTTLMLAGVREVLIVTTPRDMEDFRRLLGDGARWGLSLSYTVQDTPRGIADALRLGRGFLGGQPCALILGDNIFYGHGLPELMRSAGAANRGATIFGYWVADPARYGVLQLDAAGKARAIVEKPAKPPSNYAVTGLYFYDGRASDFADALSPSARGELEITDLNNRYLSDGTLACELLGRGFAWLDTGTPESLARAANFVETMEQRQGLKIGSPEEVAWRMGLIGADQLLALAKALGPCPYADYLAALPARG